MRKLLLGALCIAQLATPAFAQQSGPGFTANAVGTPISVTSGAGGVSGTLPPGPSVLATNVGTNTAFCQPGAAATTSAQPIGPSGYFEFQIAPGTTQLTCITSSGTTTVNLVGGSGSAYGGAGGQGGGSGGTTPVQPVARTAVSTTALASNLVVSATPANLYSFEVMADSTLNAATWYIMIFNSATLPGDGAVTPVKCISMPAGSLGGTFAFPNPVAFSTGVVIGVSTTGCFTKTASIHATLISGDL